MRISNPRTRIPGFFCLGIGRTFLSQDAKGLMVVQRHFEAIICLFPPLEDFGKVSCPACAGIAGMVGVILVFVVIPNRNTATRQLDRWLGKRHYVASLDCSSGP